MGCRSLFIIFLFGASLLHSQIVQPWTTPEKEEEIILACGKKPIAPLSEALRDLIQDISDQTFDQAFFDKIIQAESKKLTGEYVDHWENGKLKIKALFLNGKVDGHVHGWYSDGTEAFKAFFYENKKVGIHIAFYPEGHPRRCSIGIARLHCYNFEGQLDGRQEASKYDGGLKALITYTHGVLDGKIVLYNEDRKCVKDEFYENGKLIPGKKNETKR